jgi:hypothetical protein
MAYMKNDDHRSMAERFMRDQVAIMKKFGPAPKIDRDRYEQAISETQRTFRALCPSRTALGIMRKITD